MHDFLPSRLYVIIDTAVLAQQPVALVAQQLLRAGVRILQYRAKGSFTRRNWEECQSIAAMSRRHGARFFVNDRADIALLCQADGLHLGQQDLPPDAARELLRSHAGSTALIGWSTHTLPQAQAGEGLPVDYLAIGPVFQTRTKDKPDPVVGLEGVRAVRQLVRKPLVAIGGITLENAASVLECGADAVAVARDVLAAGDIEQRARQYLERLDR